MTNILKSKKFIEKGIDNELPPTPDIINNILKVSVPAAIETFLIGLVGIIDTIMVGTLGPAAISAVSITHQPFFITLTFCAGLAAGVIAIVSRRHGQNDKEGANRTLRQTLMLGFIISAIVTVLSIVFARPFLTLAGAKSDTIDDATIYFQIISSVLVFNYLRILILAGQRAVGNTKMTLITNIIANAINVVLNFLLIGGRYGFPALGVKGAAIATAVGNSVAFIIAFFSSYKSKKFITFRIRDDWSFDSETLHAIYFVSFNAFIEQVIIRIGFFLIAIIINNLGTEKVAINSITQSVISLNFNIIDGFAIGAAAFVGRYLGEEKPDISYAYGVLTLIIALLIGMIMTVLVIIFKEPLSLIFTNDAEIATQAATLLLFATIVIIPQSLQWVSTVVLRAAGDSKYTARGAMYSIMIIRPILSYILTYSLGFGLYGVWLGMFIDQTFRFIFNSIRFFNLEWIDIKV